MKYSNLLLALAVLFITACNNKRTRDFIPGTYVSNGVGNYSVADDTLVVVHSAENSYLVHRKTGFNLIRDGKMGARQYETEEWKAIYEEENQLLRELRRGKLITFYPTENKLMVGNREYKKLN